MDYQEINSKTIDSWCREGWEWGQPISHEVYEKAKNGEWGVYLTPTKTVPKEWFGELKGKRVLGLASGGGQQIPILRRWVLTARCWIIRLLSARAREWWRSGKDIRWRSCSMI